MTKSNNIRMDHFTDCVGAIEEGMKLDEFEKILPYIQQMMDALDECEFARFAPAESGLSMEQFYEKVITIIEQVDDAIKK